MYGYHQWQPLTMHQELLLSLMDRYSSSPFLSDHNGRAVPEHSVGVRLHLRDDAPHALQPHRLPPGPPRRRPHPPQRQRHDVFLG